MASRMTENIDEALLNLLSQGIIQITDDIAEDTSDYIEKSIILARANNSPTLTIIINSPGGDVEPSLVIHDILRSYSGKTTGIVIGQASSAANLILQGCDERLATFNSRLLVHDPSWGFMSQRRQRKKIYKKLEQESSRWENKVYDIYQRRSGLNRSQVVKIFMEEELMTPERALRVKFIDGIVYPEELKKMGAPISDGQDAPFQIIRKGSASRPKSKR